MKIYLKKSLKAVFAGALILSSTSAFAQSSFGVGADVVSSYVWRGFKQTNTAPNVQPYTTFTTGGLTVGAWGSADFTGVLHEFDLYATYAISDKISVTLTDYNWTFGKSYFDYGKSTDHIFEATLAFAGTEALPISASINTMFAGADKNSKSDQAFSTYIELGYQVTDNAKLFLGGSPIDDSAYGAGVTNVGFKISKSIEISDKFSLPVYGIAGFNTAKGSEDAFLVFGVSL